MSSLYQRKGTSVHVGEKGAKLVIPDPNYGCGLSENQVAGDPGSCLEWSPPIPRH